MAGGKNVGATLEDQYGQISIEELLVQNPDIILLGDSAYGVTPESVGQRSGWKTLGAVQNGKVYPFNDDLVSRPGPRLGDIAAMKTYYLGSGCFIVIDDE